MLSCVSHICDCSCGIIWPTGFQISGFLSMLAALYNAAITCKISRYWTEEGSQALHCCNRVLVQAGLVINDNYGM